MRITVLLAALTALLAAPDAEAIERGTLELGFDVSASLSTDGCDHLFELQAPSQFRLTSFVARDFAVDLRAMTIVVSGLSNTAHLTSLLFGVSPHLSRPGSRGVPFFEGLATLDMIGGTGENPASQIGFGASIGFKTHGYTVNPRFELMILRKIESDEYAALTTLRFNLGLSFFTR